MIKAASKVNTQDFKNCIHLATIRYLEIQGLPIPSPMNNSIPNSTEMLWGKSALLAKIIHAMVARLFWPNIPAFCWV